MGFKYQVFRSGSVICYLTKIGSPLLKVDELVALEQSANDTHYLASEVTVIGNMHLSPVHGVTTFFSIVTPFSVAPVSLFTITVWVSYTSVYGIFAIITLK